MVTERARTQIVDGEVAQRPGQEATPSLEQGEPQWHRQELVPWRRQSHRQEVPETERGDGPQLSALLQAPHVPLLATQGLGDGPSLRTSCRNREEQGRAGSSREQADQLPARGLRQGCDSPQAQLQSGDTELSGKRNGHRSDTGGGGLPAGEQRKSIQKPTTAEAPVQHRKRCPGLQGPRVWS